MAAISGVICWGQKDARHLVQSVMGRMAHRAPDGSRFFAEGVVGLAHGALHATPESILEQQPYAIADRWWLVVDGRIDNREVLARAFDIHASTLASLPDAHLFARAWSRWGCEFWRYVTGDFALAAWDRMEQRLCLVRDRIGVRPLFYVQTGEFLAFASEAEALIGLPGVSTEPDEDRLAYYLFQEFEDEDLGATWYRDVRRLQPGEQLTLACSGSVSVERYWRLTPLPLLRLQDEREYGEAFMDVFNEAVRCRLRSQRSPSLMLSGGMDSASILAAARVLEREGGAGTLQPVTVVLDEAGTSEESRNIERMLANGSGASAIRLPVPSFSGLVGAQEFADRIWNPAHPADNSILLPMLVYMAAARSGSNVVLDGIDGDLVTLTSRHYAAHLLFEGKPARAWREARLADRTHTYLQGAGAIRSLAKGMLAQIQPRWAAILRALIRDRLGQSVNSDTLIDRGFAARLGLRKRMVQGQLAARRAPGYRDHQAYLCGLWWNPGFTRSLEGFDHAAARFGVESRHPWCDQRVVEFFLQVPVEYKVRNGWTKHLVRSTYAGELGSEVAWHSGKDHLGPLVTARVLDATSQRVERCLRDSASVLAGLVDADALARHEARWAQRSLPATLPWQGMDEVLHLATLQNWLEALSNMPRG